MDALTFRPEPFGNGFIQQETSGGCGCAACRKSELETDDDPFSREADDSELDAGDDAFEWDVKDPRKRCSAQTPAEVEACGSMAEESPIQCHPDMTKKCPALPETWRSKTIAGVPFYYGPTIASAGSKRKEIKRDGTARPVNIVPSAWLAAQSWINAMNTTLGMPIAAVYTMGQGRYCRCVRQPKGVCREGKPEDWHKCTGFTISDHGYGDALDVIGVKWVDKKAVGSSLDTTIIHSWENREQAELLIRINAALRQSFNTVLDYSRSDHRDHFHCDMNQGRVRPVFGEKPCEQNFIMSSLKRLNYVTSATPVTWARALEGLTSFAGVVGMPVPASSGQSTAWRPIVQRLFGCIALGVAGQCARP